MAFDPHSSQAKRLDLLDMLDPYEGPRQAQPQENLAAAFGILDWQRSVCERRATALGQARADATVSDATERGMVKRSTVERRLLRNRRKR
jgi:hypothetical protein